MVKSQERRFIKLTSIRTNFLRVPARLYETGGVVLLCFISSYSQRWVARLFTNKSIVQPLQIVQEVDEPEQNQHRYTKSASKKQNTFVAEKLIQSPKI